MKQSEACIHPHPHCAIPSKKNNPIMYPTLFPPNPLHPCCWALAKNLTLGPKSVCENFLLCSLPENVSTNFKMCLKTLTAGPSLIASLLTLRVFQPPRGNFNCGPCLITSPSTLKLSISTPKCLTFSPSTLEVCLNTPQMFHILTINLGGVQTPQMSTGARGKRPRGERTRGATKGGQGEGPGKPPLGALLTLMRVL